MEINYYGNVKIMKITNLKLKVDKDNSYMENGLTKFLLFHTFCSG